jgi:hypothetical protein
MPFSQPISEDAPQVLCLVESWPPIMHIEDLVEVDFGWFARELEF